MSKEPPEDLWDWMHARSTDPETSHEAVPVNITAQCLLVLRVYAEYRKPMTDHEATRLAGLAAGTRQRCSDLRHAGFIERLEEKGRTPSGKWGYLCRITPEGLNYLAGVTSEPDTDDGQPTEWEEWRDYDPDC